MARRLVYGYILGFLSVFSSVSGGEILQPRFSGYLEPMTPQEIRRYAFCVANHFSIAAADIVATSWQDPKNGLIIWKSISDQLLNDLDFLHAHARTQSSTGLAAYEALEILHTMLREVLETSKLSDRLIGCAKVSLPAQEARQFEEYILEYSAGLFQILPNFEAIADEDFVWETRSDNYWSRGSVTLCEGRQ